MLWILIRKEIKNNLLSLPLLADRVLGHHVRLGLYVRIDDMSSPPRFSGPIRPTTRLDLRGAVRGHPVERYLCRTAGSALSVIVTGVGRNPDGPGAVFQRLVRSFGPSVPIDRNPLTTPLQKPVDIC